MPLLPVAMPGDTSSFLFLVVRPGAPRGVRTLLVTMRETSRSHEAGPSFSIPMQPESAALGRSLGENSGDGIHEVFDGGRFLFWV